MMRPSIAHTALTPGRGPQAFLRRTRGSAAFSPSDIAGLQEWWKGDGTLWQDSARTTPASADGDPVGAWDDASGNGRNATQATAGARPSLQTAELNGLPVVRFVAASSTRLTFTAHTGFSAISIFGVVKRAATSGDHTVLSLGKTLIRIDQTVNGNLEWYPDTDTTVIDAQDVADTDWHLIAVLQSSTDYEIRLDLASVTGTTVVVDPADRTDAIGSFEGGVLWFMDGDIAELLVYDSDLSDADRDAVEGYLNAKWGLGL